MPVSVRRLLADDLDDALNLSVTAGWNQRRDDWTMLLRIAGPGSFGAEEDGRIVGTALGIDYGGFGWIAMMLVDPAYRGRGIGARLLEAAMDAIPAGRPIRLDATPLGRPLYERYGFQLESTLTRYVRSAGAIGDAETARVQPISGALLARIVECDARTFQGARGAVLEWAARDAPDYARAIDEATAPLQYCFGRGGRLFHQIGPVVASNASDASALTRAALTAASNRSVAIDAFDAEDAFTAWLRAHGFEPQRPLYRMRRGAAGPAPDSGLREFAIFGPEFA